MFLLIHFGLQAAKEQTGYSIPVVGTSTEIYGNSPTEFPTTYLL